MPGIAWACLPRGLFFSASDTGCAGCPPVEQPAAAVAVAVVVAAARRSKRMGEEDDENNGGMGQEGEGNQKEDKPAYGEDGGGGWGGEGQAAHPVPPARTKSTRKRAHAIPGAQCPGCGP